MNSSPHANLFRILSTNFHIARQTAIFLVLAALLIDLGFGACSSGYSCPSNKEYAWCSPDGKEYRLTCPFGVDCVFTKEENFPYELIFTQSTNNISCDVANVASTPYKYQCDPDRCQPPNCLCASNKPPAGLQPIEVPQMVMLTFDDAITSFIWPYVSKVTHRGAAQEKTHPSLDSRLWPQKSE